MRTKAVRIYGEMDLRLEEFELPALQDDEVLVKVISDSLCMSSYKAIKQGPKHKRVPNDVAENPTIIGHEFCGEVVEVGEKRKNMFSVGDKVAIQPALNDPSDLYSAPGYSFPYIGGDATYVIVPSRVIDFGCLLKYNGEGYFYGSLSEPVACVISGFHTNYHNIPGRYTHTMDIVMGGKMAILAGAGPMGLGAVDYAIHRNCHPSLLVVTDVDDARLARAASIYPPEEAAKYGVELHYINTGKIDDPVQALRDLTGGTGYDDVFVYAPVAPVVEQGSAILGHDGCMNFFAGPTNTAFCAPFNFYNVHYDNTHIAGSSGSNLDDVFEALSMMSCGQISPNSMVTHIGGLDCVAETTMNLPNIPGGKKLIYTHISMPLTAIDDFEKLGESDPMYKKLAELVKANKGLWSVEAEKYLLENAKPL